MRLPNTVPLALLSAAMLFIGGAQSFAQSGANTPPVNQNMQGHSGHGNMDMQTMANQCTEMRRQMRSNASTPPSADQQKMMAQCNQMDKAMGNQPSGAAAGSAPPTMDDHAH